MAMPTDDPKRGEPPSPLAGFQTYADDTPRDYEADHSEPWRQPGRRSWEVAPAMDPVAPDEAYAEPPRRALWPKLAVGVAVLAAFGGGVLLARNDGPAPGPRPASEAAAMAAAAPMNVELAAVTPTPPALAADTGKMEVLPPVGGRETSLVPRVPALRTAPSAAPEMRTLPIGPAPAPMAASPPEAAEAPIPRDAVALVPPPARASFDCRDAPTRAREMVCRDAGLAAMDRRMKQAYAIAMASGAPREDLEADQADWLDVREDAANLSRRAVADIYRQRIDELDAMAGRR
ncbi:MAG: DUF1311 domain-containing protein [Alphaproteobacteria bacterium]|nr:DUF1311 domain-containing protein [Alphaproteobacteria bacterium]MBU1514276.1 DUF1311 domain-containing protein [Alphaproteobacteria bacterium]MBU2097064.1 DUF1311 domain-containing protein [Alphaproteobacteria bacterium]MBU2152538.1 DUF1311 domain-containing protein [Alphaproteobacteria bacterium]MBU2308475.1 DUF1311 domain-containing protein [Alphaproteobacteria bacterium]